MSVGPGAYKIPSMRSIPRQLRVHLLEKTAGPASVMGSKAVGEPPLFLGASVFFAIRDAVTRSSCRVGEWAIVNEISRSKLLGEEERDPASVDSEQKSKTEHSVER